MAGGASTSSPRRSPGRLDRSRDPQILDAALRGVAELGYDRLTMDDIAKRKAKRGEISAYAIPELMALQPGPEPDSVPAQQPLMKVAS